MVFTGLSGSGKSSLAFDTIYAEGQRRYVESLSAYARQFLEMMQKPDVDQIDGLSPAISIEQKTTSKNPRSTVGTTRNAVMLISHYDHLVTVEGAEWGRATALRGALERLGPILMTALVTALGLLPLAIGSGDPGREIEGPMAIVILGGLLTSTALSLFVLPTLALRFGRFHVPPTRTT